MMRMTNSSKTLLSVLPIMLVLTRTKKLLNSKCNARESCAAIKYNQLKPDKEGRMMTNYINSAGCVLSKYCPDDKKKLYDKDKMKKKTFSGYEINSIECPEGAKIPQPFKLEEKKYKD